MISRCTLHTFCWLLLTALLAGRPSGRAYADDTSPTSSPSHAGSTPPPFAFALDPQRAATLAELERQHAQLHVTRWMALSAVGGVALLVTAGLLVPGAMMVQRESCGDDPTEGCDYHDTGRNLLVASAVTGALSATLLAISLPRLVREAKQARRLNADIRRLQQPNAWLSPTREGAQAGLGFVF